MNLSFRISTHQALRPAKLLWMQDNMTEAFFEQLQKRGSNLSQRAGPSMNPKVNMAAEDLK